MHRGWLLNLWKGGGLDTGRGFSLTVGTGTFTGISFTGRITGRSFSLTVCAFTSRGFTIKRATHLVRYQMPQTSLSMQPSVLRLLGVHLQLLQMQKKGRHPTHPEMFQMTQARTAPDGSVMWSNEQSRQMMNQMTQLRNSTPSEESDATANPLVLTPEEAFRLVFGRDRPGRIRCGGRGQTLRSWYGPSEGGSSSNTIY
ncbi:hypothetical protein Taro_045128 [Colocasia esculenta]|uniref:Uncharacterized protein n=1 Tax=Colocasia esculenta TaxID=4460 RepID=A0A843X256_COLES|nr:hypothetical protein [Colocasia esculenta]